MGIVISLPRAKQGTKASIVTTCITAIIMTVLAIVFLIPAFGGGDLEVVQKFAVSTSLTGDSSSPYQYTITGEVQNTTDETMYNVRFRIEVDGESAEYIGYTNVTIDEIGPGEIARVQDICYGDEVYTSIYSVEYSVNGGSSKTLRSGSSDLFTSLIMGVVALIMWIIFAVSIVKYKKKKNQAEAQFGGATANTFGGPVSTNDGEVVSNPFATTTQPTQPQTQAPTAVSAQTCPYCGSKVASTDGKCPGCGAKL